MSQDCSGEDIPAGQSVEKQAQAAGWELALAGRIRPARVSDVPVLYELIRHYALEQKMILRTYEELYAHIREFQVGECDAQVVGCAAVHVFYADLAELKCVAVRQDYQGRGLGTALCRACLDDLRRLGVGRVFTLTGSPAFFEKLGFQRVAKDTLPHYIWSECVRCPTFPICREEALILDLSFVKSGL
ncbi:MAG: GNAT family N-acetyltransferase [Gemmataceae bacterium]